MLGSDISVIDWVLHGADESKTLGRERISATT